MKFYIAVDIGGTQIRVAVFPEEGVGPVQQKRIPTRSASETAVERLIGLIQELWPEEGEVVAIGAAAPGPTDAKAGVIHSAPNIPGWFNLPLKKLLEDAFNVPVRLGNDANMAAVGEWKFGAGQGHHHLLYFTISTGIGGGVIVDDRLLLGTYGLAAELGHVTIMQDGPTCGCGHRGHLEAVASGTAIAAYVAEQMAQGTPSILSNNPRPSSLDIYLAARQGDELSVTAITRAGTYMGQAIANYLHIFNPSIIILGGGVSHSGDLLFNPLREALEKDVLDPEYLRNLTITTAALGDDAGLLGALALARGQIC